MLRFLADNQQQLLFQLLFGVFLVRSFRFLPMAIKYLMLFRYCF
jgi:hypothetical protein